MAQQGLKVELVKCENTRRYDNKQNRWVGESFEGGERVILVNGVRWGRTCVARHGVWGTSHTFEQDGGDRIPAIEGESRDRSKYVQVRSMTKRRMRDDTKWRPTEEMVLEKARELVASGRLRDPAVVKLEAKQEHERWLAEREQRDRERVDAIRAKAAEALQLNNVPAPGESVVLDRVVAAMEWAQTQ